MTSYIYFLQAKGDGPIKIGFTTDSPANRKRNLQTGCPWPIKLIGAIEGTESQEKQIHFLLSRWNTKGEWFEPHPIVLAAVRTAIEFGKAISVPEEKKRTSKHILTAYRYENNLTLLELATRVGCKQPFLSMVERGLRSPSLRLANRISRETGIPIEVFASNGSVQ